MKKSYKIFQYLFAIALIALAAFGLSEHVSASTMLTAGVTFMGFGIPISNFNFNTNGGGTGGMNPPRGRSNQMASQPVSANLAAIPKQMVDLSKSSLITQQQNGSIIPVGPATKVNPGGVSQVGSVFDVGSLVGSSTLPSSIDFTLDNSGGVADVNYLIFDEFGFFAANSAGAFSAPTSASSSVTGISKMSASSQIMIKGYNYQVTNTTQYANPLFITFGDADGTFSSKPVQNQQAKRNTQFVATLLTFETVIYVDGFRGVSLLVNQGEIVNLSLFLSAGYNRQ